MTVHLLGSGTERSQGRLGGFRKFNYAPTLAEAVSILAGGVPESLRGASVVPFKESTETAVSVGNWNGSNMAFTAGESAAGHDDWVKGVITGGDGRAGFLVTSAGINSRLNKLLLIEFSVYVPAASVSRSIGLGINIGSFSAAIQFTILASNRLGVGRGFGAFTCPPDEEVKVWAICMADSASSVADRIGIRYASATVGDVALIRKLRATQIGLTADLPPESIQLAPGQWLDTSGNGKHAYIPDGFRLGAASRSGDLSSVLTWEASSTDPRYVTGVNASAVPANSAVTLYARATASGTFNIGDGSNGTYYASAVSIGTTWTPITLTNSVNDGTNRKIVFTPASAYAGSVTISAQVQVLA